MADSTYTGLGHETAQPSAPPVQHLSRSSTRSRTAAVGLASFAGVFAGSGSAMIAQASGRLDGVVVPLLSLAVTATAICTTLIVVFLATVNSNDRTTNLVLIIRAIREPQGVDHRHADNHSATACEAVLKENPTRAPPG